MLGWALKKGFQGATGTRDAPTNVGGGGDDTTQFEAPDTPAPVFAARAIKNAIFGDSGGAVEGDRAPTNSKRDRGRDHDHDRDRDRDRDGPAKHNVNATAPTDIKSPNKPTSILLTPGTGTARRKRVSFGNDVKSGNHSEPGSVATNPDGTRRKTSLQQALENSRSSRSKHTPNSQNTKKKNPEPVAPPLPAKNDGADSEGEWEDDVCNHDVTVDLNEPHSNSGLYWKSEFNRYHEEAQAEMDKLVRYKHMAKSYAKKKDAEAINLTQRLQEEQNKVMKMEQKIAEMAAQIADKGKQGGDNDNAALMKDLAKQTKLAAQYRDQVSDLEAILKGQNDGGHGRSARLNINTSPRTEKTILEVNRELRRARSELRQMESLREENARLKSDLEAQQEARDLTQENKKSGDSAVDSSRVQRLEDKLREVREELRKKDSDMRKLNRDYESLKRDAKARTGEAMQVLDDKNKRINELQDEIKTLKAENASIRQKSIDTALAEHSKITRDLKTDIESLNRPARYRTVPRTRQTRQRSVSMEDMSLELTQRSIYELGENKNRPTTAAASDVAHPTYTNLSVDLTELEHQLRKDKVEASKHDRQPLAKTPGAGLGPPATSVATKTHQPSSFSSRRVMSDRINESKPSDNIYGTVPAARERRPSVYSRDTNGHRTASGSGNTRSTTIRPTSERVSTAAATTSSRTRPNSVPVPPPQPSALGDTDDDTQGIDLLKDRYARLGGDPGYNYAAGSGSSSSKSGGRAANDRDGPGGAISTSATTATSNATSTTTTTAPGTTANTSRCTLPADRLAAANARIAQKKLARQRKKASTRAGRAAAAGDTDDVDGDVVGVGVGVGDDGLGVGSGDRFRFRVRDDDGESEAEGPAARRRRWGQEEGEGRQAREGGPYECERVGEGAGAGVGAATVSRRQRLGERPRRGGGGGGERAPAYHPASAPKTEKGELDKENALPC